MEILYLTYCIIIIGFINIVSLLLRNTKTNNLHCGIIGFSGTRPFDSHKIKSLMLWNSLERGTDSTGVYTVESGVIKDTESADKFIIKNFNNEDSKIKPSNLFISHVRKKSIGSNTVNNAHPHQFGGSIVAHNGTLTNYNELARMYGIAHNSYFSDSQVLAEILNINYNSEEPFKVLSEYEGAAAILMYNSKTETLYACRDLKRPLYYGYINKTEMYISSIEDSLKYIGCENISQFTFETIFKIKDGKIEDKIDYPEIENHTDSLNIRVAWKSDIDRKWSFKKYIYEEYLNEGDSGKASFTGLAQKDLETKYLIGYNIRYNGSNIRYKKPLESIYSASLIKNNYYLVLDIDKDKPGIIIIQDEDGLIKSVDVIRFDISRIIPTRGFYITLLSDIVNKNNDKIGFEGDVLKVTYHEWRDNFVHIKDCISNTFYKVPLRLCRVSNDDEAQVYENFLKNYSKDIKNENEKKLLVAPKSKEETDFAISEKALEIINDEDLRDIDHDKDEDSPWDNYNNEDIDSYIKYSIVRAFICDIGFKLENLIEKNKDNSDIKKEIEDIASFAIEGLDQTQLEATYD